MKKIEINIQTGEKTEVDLTPEEIAENEAKALAQIPIARRAEILTRLKEIDVESVRGLRAKSVGKGKPQDDTKLTDLDSEADALRLELTTL